MLIFFTKSLHKDKIVYDRIHCSVRFFTEHRTEQFGSVFGFFLPNTEHQKPNTCHIIYRTCIGYLSNIHALIFCTIFSAMQLILSHIRLYCSWLITFLQDVVEVECVELQYIVVYSKYRHMQYIYIVFGVRFLFGFWCSVRF